jgi:hypothetical protein
MVFIRIVLIIVASVCVGNFFGWFTTEYAEKWWGEVSLRHPALAYCYLWF